MAAGKEMRKIEPVSFTESNSIHPIFQVKNLEYKSNGITLLDSINFEIMPQQIFVLLGENGSGKSLLIEALANDIHYKGEVEWRADITRERRTIAYDSFATLPGLKVREVLELLHAFYKRPADPSLYEVMKLRELEDKPAGILSKGERKRVGIYAALFSSPPLAILDEPTDGMDPMMRAAFWRVIENCSGAIMLTTHMWDEAEAVHDRIAMIRRGQLLHPPTSAKTLKALVSPFTGKIRVPSLPENSCPPGQVIRRDGASFIFYRDDAGLDKLTAWLRESDLISAGYSTLPIDLADVYHWLMEPRDGA